MTEESVIFLLNIVDSGLTIVISTLATAVVLGIAIVFREIRSSYSEK